MVVILVLLTFATFVAIDFLLTRRREATAGEAGLAGLVPALAAAGAPPAAGPVWVAGYELPEDRHYHRGHTWARVLSADTVAVGIDDFARRLLHRSRGVGLPAVGSWMEQGGRAFRVQADGHRAHFVSPVEGEVVEVNGEVRERPALATEDPYGRGWLFKVRSANLAANLRNLLGGSVARRWTEDAREQLDLRLMALSGSVLQDGGEPAPGFAAHLDREEWERLAETFFLTR